MTGILRKVIICTVRFDAKSCIGNAILFHMIAGIGIMNIRKRIGMEFFLVSSLPKKYIERPQMVMIIEIPIMKRSEPSVPKTNRIIDSARITKPQLAGFINSFWNAVLLCHIIYAAINGTRNPWEKLGSVDQSWINFMMVWLYKNMNDDIRMSIWM